MTNDQLKKARQQMKEWMELTRGQKSKAERVRKWRELVRDILQDTEIGKAEAGRAKATRARRKELAVKFQEYR